MYMYILRLFHCRACSAWRYYSMTFKPALRWRNGINTASNVHILQGSSYEIEKTFFTDEMLRSLLRSIRGWSTNILTKILINGVLWFLHENRWLVRYGRSPPRPNLPYPLGYSVTFNAFGTTIDWRVGTSVTADLRKFMSDNADKFAVDSFYRSTDFFGYNGSCNM